MPTSVPRRIVVAVAVVSAVGITTNTLIGPAMPELLDAFGAADSTAGLVIAAGSAPGILVAPLAGFLGDRWGRREVIVPCLLLFGIAGGLAGLAPNLTTLVVLRVLQGAGSAGLINLAVTVIGDNWTGERRATMIGRNSALITILIGTLPFLGGVLVDNIGWRAVFAVYPVAVVAAVFVWRWLPRGSKQDVRVAEQFAAVRPLLTERSFVATLFATMIAFALIFSVLITILPLYTERVLGLSATVRGIVLGLPAIGSTTAALTTGRLASRFGRRRVMVAASVCYGVGLLALASVSTLAAVVVGIVLFGFGEGLFIPLLQDAATSAGGDDQRGTLVAAQVGVARLGQTAGPVTIAPLVGPIGYAGTYLVGAALSLGPLAWLSSRTPRATSVDEVEPVVSA